MQSSMYIPSDFKFNVVRNEPQSAKKFPLLQEHKISSAKLKRFIFELKKNYVVSF